MRACMPNRESGAGLLFAVRPRVLRMAAWMGAIVVLSGCVVRPGRDYGSLLYRPSPFFQVQMLDLRIAAEDPLPIRDLLLLPPVGDAPMDVVREFPLLQWQELQQVLMGVVRMPRPGGPYVQYAGTSNLMGSNGRIDVEELFRIGLLAGASHVLLPVIVDYRPYHPQRITMEWVLLQVANRSVSMIVVGAIDASEQRVLIAADAYLRHRKASPYDSSSLDMLLRSPRAFTGFAMHEAVAALQGKVVPFSMQDAFKNTGTIAELAVRE
jgi:hypothetical protein